MTMQNYFAEIAIDFGFQERQLALCVMETQTILDKGIMPSEKVLDFPVDCNTLTGSVNL